MATLTISHLVFLSREQRYNLFHGNDLEVIGVSVPVWLNKGESSEPAIEVFAKYKLMNRDDRIFIRQKNGSYEVTVPPIEESPNDPLPDEIWNVLTPEEQDKWHIDNEPNPSLINLLDIKDGGCGWLAFRQYSKLEKTSPVGALHVIHFVEIKDVTELEQSLS
jgi:hypothetical protein